MAGSVHGLEPCLEIDAEKCFALVERLAVAIEVPVVVFREPPGGRPLPGQQPGGERHACEDAHLAFLCFGKEQFRRTLAEEVENDLHRLGVGNSMALRASSTFSTLTP